MLVGILSDSHGKHLTVRRAIELFDRLGVEHIIHCGDVCGMAVFDELVDRPCTFVWGNMDFPDDALMAYLDSIGLAAPQAEPTRVNLDGKSFAVFHGHEGGFHNAVDTLQVDYLLHGHTHITRDESRGITRIINPGALQRAKVKTVATLDTGTDQLTFHEITPG